MYRASSKPWNKLPDSKPDEAIGLTSLVQQNRFSRYEVIEPKDTVNGCVLFA